MKRQVVSSTLEYREAGLPESGLARNVTQTERFAHLFKELERVGVDPNTLSAGLAVSEDDVLRALTALPDGAGPAAFLAQLRRIMGHTDIDP